MLGENMVLSLLVVESNYSPTKLIHKGMQISNTNNKTVNKCTSNKKKITMKGRLNVLHEEPTIGG